MLVILILCILFKTKTHIVSGESMAPTLNNKDCLVVIKTQKVARYEMVTFDPVDSPDTSYVKRIIGIPGDKLRVENNQLYLSMPSFEKAKGDELSDSTLVFSLTEKKAVQRFEGLTTIPKDHYLVLGDNRGNSKDSRAFGLIEKKQIEGKVMMRYFPFNKVEITH